MSYVEIHFHLLPGLDDGPSSVQESVALAAAAAREGTRTIVATPHVHRDHVTDPLVVPDCARELAAHFRRERLGVTILPGGELAHHMVGRLRHHELEAIAQGIPGRRWLLVEAPFVGLDEGFTTATDELRARGFAVVVAHPERTPMRSPTARAVLEHELVAGSALQLSAWSFAGLYGERARRVALGLLRAAPLSVIASDAHGGIRMPSLSLALDAVAAAGEADPRRLACANPRALLGRGLRATQAALAA